MFMFRPLSRFYLVNYRWGVKIWVKENKWKTENRKYGCLWEGIIRKTKYFWSGHWLYCSKLIFYLICCNMIQYYVIQFTAVPWRTMQTQLCMLFLVRANVCNITYRDGLMPFYFWIHFTVIFSVHSFDISLALDIFIPPQCFLHPFNNGQISPAARNTKIAQQQK